MNKMLKYLSVVIVLFMSSGETFAQFELSVPAITKQEFFNPAFNAYKSHISLNMMSRQQWYNAGVEGPKVLALNGYAPIGKNAIGIGGTIISEKVGLRNINTAYFNLTKELKVAMDSRLAFGLGIGVQNENYNRNEMRHYPEVNFNGVELNQTNPAFSMGLMLMISNFYIGASSNITASKNDFDYKYLAGFDGVMGMVKVVNADFVYRIGLVGKYYVQNKFETGKDGQLNNSYVDPIVDLSFSCFLYDRIWIGTSHRFKEAQTISLSARIGKSKRFTLGYLYELGIGTGLNQFDTQGIYLSYNFLKKGKSGRKGYFQRRKVRYVKPLSEYLY